MQNQNTEERKEWFSIWFDTRYYNQLYKQRNEHEALVFITKMIQLIPQSQHHSLLDVGCGNGRHTIAFNQFIDRVVGIDISPQKIEEAKQKSSAAIEYFVHDMRKAFAYKPFDIVSNLFTSFGYCDNEIENDLFFKNMCDAVKEGGYFIFDYLNATAFVNDKIVVEKKTIDNVVFTIGKFQDPFFFYKKILVHDLTLHQEFVFQEKVKKYSLPEIIQKLDDNQMTLVDVYGNYTLDFFNHPTSPRLIVLAKKQPKVHKV